MVLNGPTTLVLQEKIELFFKRSKVGALAVCFAFDLWIVIMVVISGTKWEIQQKTGIWQGGFGNRLKCDWGDAATSMPSTSIRLYQFVCSPHFLVGEIWTILYLQTPWKGFTCAIILFLFVFWDLGGYLSRPGSARLSWKGLDKEKGTTERKMCSGLGRENPIYSSRQDPNAKPSKIPKRFTLFRRIFGALRSTHRHSIISHLCLLGGGSTCGCGLLWNRNTLFRNWEAAEECRL